MPALEIFYCLTLREEKNMLNKRKGCSNAVMCSLALIAFSGMTQAKDLTVYGKIHLSGDYIDNDAIKDYTIASNSSRIGFKGDKKLKYGLTGVYKIESGIDLEGESGTLSARNRYAGLKHKDFGTVIGGYHDTPYKTFGKKAGVFADTIGDRRGVLGADGEGSNTFNTRGKKSVMYTSPNISGVEVRAMWATGAMKDGTNDKDPLLSGSVVYKQKMFYVGASYEDQKSKDATGMRLGGGAIFGDTKVNLMFEKLSSDTDKLDRPAYGGSVSHKMGATTLKAHLFILGEYTDTDDSGAMLYAIGADHKLDKKVSMYAMIAGVSNQDNGAVNLAASGHGEKYTSAAGDSLMGASVGMVYKF